MKDTILCKHSDTAQIRRKRINKIVKDIVEAIKISKTPEFQTIFDHDLEQDIRNALIESYAELCELIGHKLLSMQWGIVGDNGVLRKPRNHYRRIQARKTKAGKIFTTNIVIETLIELGVIKFEKEEK